jgi:4-phytase/acid phosphatase
LLAPAVSQAEGLRLERVVIIMRHGVRPPTKSADALASLAEKPWPDDRAWGAAPGELTPHGAQAIRKLGGDLHTVYVREGLFATNSPLADETMIWADGRDERTRETARALALGLEPAAPPAFGAVPDGGRDPLFSGPEAGSCPFDPQAARAAVLANGPPDTERTAKALARLQQIFAPLGCTGGAGVCLSGPTTVEADARNIHLEGPLETGATLAEDLLLEYENGLPPDQVGWGRATREDLDAVMAAHDRTAVLARRTPYIATRRGSPLARLVLEALRHDAVAAPAGPRIEARDRLIVLVGHDTNLSNVGGALGVDWALPGQPDPTAPGTAIAFERWRDEGSGKAFIRVRIFYQDPDQVRSLSGAPARQARVIPAACSSTAGDCTLEAFAEPARRAIDQACPAPTASATGAAAPIIGRSRSRGLSLSSGR